LGKDGADLEDLLIQKKPDLAILDIELPVEDAITILSRQKIKPATIFITAHPSYAIKAFEYEAIDFLLKPLSLQKFKNAANRAIRYFNLLKKNIKDNIEENKIKVLWVQENGITIPVLISDIAFFESQKKNTLACLFNKKCVTIPMSISSIYKKIEHLDFIQIHRRYIVNIAAIAKMEPLFHGTYEVHVKGCNRVLPVSRRCSRKILKK